MPTNKQLHVFIGLFLPLLITGCVDTHLRLDLREPEHGQLDVRAVLKPAAINMLKLANPELIHGKLDERAKQIRTCQAFFKEDAQAKEIFGQSTPLNRDGVTLTKQINYTNNLLTCGFKAEGPAASLFKLVESYKMLNFSQVNDRYQINLETRQSAYGNLTDFGLLGLNSMSEDVPTLNMTILGHQLQSNFEPGEINATRFELSENLLGERKQFQTQFTVSVKSTPPNLIERLSALFNEFLIWAQSQWNQLQAP